MGARGKAGQPQVRRCAALNRKGEPCKARPMVGSDYCSLHADPARAYGGPADRLRHPNRSAHACSRQHPSTNRCAGVHAYQHSRGHRRAHGAANQHARANYDPLAYRASRIANAEGDGHICP